LAPEEDPPELPLPELELDEPMPLAPPVLGYWTSGADIVPEMPTTAGEGHMGGKVWIVCSENSAAPAENSTVKGSRLVMVSDPATVGWQFRQFPTPQKMPASGPTQPAQLPQLVQEAGGSGKPQITFAVPDQFAPAWPCHPFSPPGNAVAPPATTWMQLAFIVGSVRLYTVPTASGGQLPADGLLNGLM
jgi:hypothetical protein